VRALCYTWTVSSVYILVLLTIHCFFNLILKELWVFGLEAECSTSQELGSLEPFCINSMLSENYVCPKIGTVVYSVFSVGIFLWIKIDNY